MAGPELGEPAGPADAAAEAGAEARSGAGFEAEARRALRRRQAVGILLVAAAVLGFTLLRAEWRGIFPVGWWRW